MGGLPMNEFLLILAVALIEGAAFAIAVIAALIMIHRS